MLRLIILVFALMLNGFFDATAQIQRGGMAQLIIQNADQLNLTDAQKSELAALSVAQSREMQEQRQAMRQDGTRPAGQMRGFQTEVTHKSFAVLTEDQKSKVKAIRIQQAENQLEFQKLRSREAIKAASLPADKSARVQSLMGAHHQKLHELRIAYINESMNGPSNQLEKLPEIREAFRNEMQSMLTVAEYRALFSQAGFQQEGMQPQRGNQPNRRAGNRNRN